MQPTPERPSDDAIELHLQPISSLATGQVRCAESFLRRRHPTKGIVPTMQWMPEADAGGELVAIARAMLEPWRHQATRAGMTVSFNLSSPMLANDRFVTDLLAIPPADSENLALEIPHAQFVLDRAAIIEPMWTWTAISDLDDRLEDLHSHGFEIWLDDFCDETIDATVTHPHIDVIKLDKCHARGEPAALRTISHQITDAGKSIVLEGIESEAHAELALDAGIELGQGFKISPPMDPETFHLFCTDRER